MSETPGLYNIVGLTLYIDALDDPAACLRRLRQEGWISLQRTDTMDTELADAPAEQLPRLTEAGAAYPEALGPMVSVRGSQEDSDRLGEIFAILFPGANRATCRDNRIRDAIRVATSIRYGGYGFITRATGS